MGGTTLLPAGIPPSHVFGGTDLWSAWDALEYVLYRKVCQAAPQPLWTIGGDAGVLAALGKPTVGVDRRRRSRCGSRWGKL